MAHTQLTYPSTSLSTTLSTTLFTILDSLRIYNNRIYLKETKFSNKEDENLEYYIKNPDEWLNNYNKNYSRFSNPEYFNILKQLELFNNFLHHLECNLKQIKDPMKLITEILNLIDGLLEEDPSIEELVILKEKYNTKMNEFNYKKTNT